MRRLLVVQTHIVVRLVTSLLIAAGMGALIAMAFVMQPTQDWIEWIRPVRQTALSIGVSFAVAGALALFLLPGRLDLRRSAASTTNPDLAAGSLLLLMALAIGAIWQVPTLLAWWAESMRLVDQLVPGRTDPSGLWIIPAMMVSAPPFVASVIVALFVETSIGGAAARSPQAERLLRACVLLQGGLVIGSSLALAAIQELLARVVALAAAGPDPSVVAAITNAAVPQNVFATTVLFRFQLLFAGYVIAVASTWYLVPSQPADATVSSGSPVSAPFPAAVVITAPASPAAVVLSPAVTSLFSASEYEVRLRTHWLMAAFRLGPLEYEITPTDQKTSDVRVSFSMSDGVLRRTSSGEPVLTVKPAGSGWSLKTAYVVAEPSGAVVGIFEKDGSDWNLFDEARRPIAQVQQVEARKGRFRYCMRAHGSEVCSFTWAMRGLGVWTAAMNVEFGGPPTPHSVYAIALAAILEGKARRASQWMN